MPDLLTRETARVRADRIVTDCVAKKGLVQVSLAKHILILQAEALEWAAELLWKYDDDALADRLSGRATRLREEAG